MYFTSKKDAVYFLAVWGTGAMLLLSIVLQASFSILAIIWTLIGLALIGFLAWLWFGTGYRIENETIHIQNGPFKMSVEIRDIKRISKTKSLLATPSLSIDRLVLHYGTYGEIQLSPKDEQAFIALLLKENAHIQLAEEVSKCTTTERN